MVKVGISVLRDNLRRYINRVRDGEEVVVTDHGKAVARIVPPEQPGRLERLIADGVVTPPLDPKRARLGKRITPTAPVSPLVIEDRR